MKKILTIIIILAISLSAQSQTLKAFVKAADDAMLTKDYYTAVERYKNALDIDPKRVDLQYKEAEAARLFSAYELAETYYKSVLESKDSATYPLARYHLGEIQILEGKYPEAKQNLLLFSSTSANSDPEVSSRVALGLKKIEFSTEQRTPVQENANLIKLDETVNSEWNEFAPSVINGKLYFTSMRFQAEMDKRDPPRRYGGVLEKEGEQIGKKVDIPGSGGTLHFAHAAINHKEDKIYFTICENLNDYDIRCDLYTSDFGPAGWGKPVKLEEPVNAPGFSTTQPSLSYNTTSNTERLFFVSNRPGGKGNKDIWYVDINSDGQMGSPVNLTALNTVEDEITPNYHSQSNTLYFSSDGYPGFGGYDVYSSKWTNNTWTSPVNMGSPVNTSRNDLYYWLNEREDTAYLASNREGSTFLVKEKNACCNDIYLTKYVIINLKAYTFESATKQALNGCTVKLYELTPQGKMFIAELTNPETNLSVFRLMPGHDYRVIASKSGFDPDSALITTKGITESKDIIQNLYLKPSKIELNVFTFDDATKLPLHNCKVQLYDITNNKNDLLFEKINPNANDFTFSLDPCKKYRLIVYHDGYITHMEEFETPCDGSAKSIRKDVYLKRMSLEDYLPLAVYFDNDVPDKRSIARRTKVDYLKTYDNYYPKKEHFIERYCFKVPSEARIETEKQVNTFFEENVKGGRDSLDQFTALLLEILKTGEKIKLEIRGYTSPLASSGYNLRLGSRRVSSMMNYFTKYNDGALNQYLKSGQLKLREVSYGESKAKRSISDSRKDLRKSIFSPEASRERRSEVVDITRTAPKKSK